MNTSCWSKFVLSPSSHGSGIPGLCKTLHGLCLEEEVVVDLSLGHETVSYLIAYISADTLPLGGIRGVSRGFQPRQCRFFQAGPMSIKTGFFRYPGFHQLCGATFNWRSINLLQGLADEALLPWDCQHFAVGTWWIPLLS